MSRLMLPGLTVVAVFTATLTPVRASYVRMQWRDLGPDDAEVTLAVGETAIIDIYFEMNFPSETLASLAFENQIWYPQENVISQVATQAAQPGWSDFSVDGTLGNGLQRVEWTAATGSHLLGPGEYLIGSQTIRLDDFGSGYSAAIVFDRYSLQLLDESGVPYTYAPNLADVVPNFYDMRLGDPGGPFIGSPPPDPLFVHIIPEPDGLVLLAVGAVACLGRRFLTHPAPV